MELIFTCILVFLFVLAIFDLVVGVSNDAVNFLTSAIGAKVAPFKVVLAVAAVGIFLGATLSNGMMDIARNGIYNPAYFTFEEVMVICLSAIVTDVILLNIFNSLGLPTSTTVSMVFELLGASFCMSMLKISDGSVLSIGELLNTGKAIEVIIAIFMSVAVAFFFGMLVQWISRVIFTFNYKRNLRYFAGIFGGLAITSIIYFMLIKGLHDASFMTPQMQSFIDEHTGLIMGGAFVVLSLVMQGLHYLGVNVFKIIVLAGTLALSLAFAGNDLVNFIGVPLAGLSAYQDYIAHGAGAYSSYLMEANNASAQTPIYFLIGAGAVMVLALLFSKSAHNVIQTSVNLSRQDDGEETYGSSKIARGLVRTSHNMAVTVNRLMPEKAKRWIDSRFDKRGLTLESGAAFDLVRASVNLVLSGLLIALGTSMKLPLSTTYVTFMVAMGSSFSDRAWSRESAVGRITGVMSVIGGWFITAGAAFTIAVGIAISMKYGGFVVMIIFIALSIFLLFNSHIFKRKKDDEDDALFVQILTAERPEDMWPLLSTHVRNNQMVLLRHVAEDYKQLTEAFLHEDFRALRRVQIHTEEYKRQFKSMRRKETLCLRRMPNEDMLEKNMWFHLGANACLQMLYAIERSAEVCVEHVGNNFNPLPEALSLEFIPIRDRVLDYIEYTGAFIEGAQTETVKKARSLGKELREEIKDMRKAQMKRTHRGDKENFKVSLVYMNMLQETNEILNNLRHLLSYSQGLQDDENK